MKQIMEPVIITGQPTPDDLRRCEEMGLALAAGLSLGIY